MDRRNSPDGLSRDTIAALNQRFAASDREAGFEISDDFQSFNQMDDMFTRAFWDESVRSADTDAFFQSYRMEFAPRRGTGFSQTDFALRNAACPCLRPALALSSCAV